MRQLSTLLLAAALCGGANLLIAQESSSGQGTTASQDMHNAGRDTKNAARDTGNATKKGTKKAWHKTKRGTKKAWHKTKNTTKGAVQGGQQGAQEPAR